MGPEAALLEAALAGERAALARLLSLAERGGESLLAIEQGVARKTGQAHIIGITGAPGAGKSTLISALLPLATEHARTAVLAVDPSSPFSRGALLGDRIRMQGRDHGSEVFIRSMASRGEVGGLARSAATCVRLFDACGWPIVIIETLGIGQVELDIMDIADSVVVVLTPDWGDEIQANKAGLTEAGDVFVINKADKPGSQQTRKELQDSLTLLGKSRTPPVVETVATSGQGMDTLWTTLLADRDALHSDEARLERRQTRRQRLLRKIIYRELEQRLDRVLDSDKARQLLEDTSTGEMDLQASVDTILASITTGDIPA